MLKKYGPLSILAGLIVIMAIASPYFLTADNLETVAKQNDEAIHKVLYPKK